MWITIPKKILTKSNSLSTRRMQAPKVYLPFYLFHQKKR